MKGKLRDLFWRNVGDPVVRLIESRLDHYKSLEPARLTIINDLASIHSTAVFLPGASLTIYPGPDREVDSKCSIGAYSHVRGELLIGPRGALSIGDFCFVGPGSKIWAQYHIEIGRNVLISHNVDIHDSNSHSLNWEARRTEAEMLFRDFVTSSGKGVKTATVHIEDDVWVGFKATILKGVRVGARSIIAAGSLVTKDVPPDTLVAGSPAKIVRSLD